MENRFIKEIKLGKSMLIEGIEVAYGFNAEGGTKDHSFSTYERNGRRTGIL